MEAIIESLDATTQITECKEHASTAECICEYAYKKISVSTVAKTAADKVMSYANAASNIINDVKECKQSGHSTAACVTGATVGAAAMVATDFMSTALILNAPATPARPLMLAVGVNGLINSREMGRDFAHVATGIVDYLIDHVPASVIDVNAPLIIRRNDAPHQEHTEIVFAPSEVKMVRDLVQINQHVQRACAVVRAETAELTEQYEEFKVPLQDAIANYCDRTRRLEMNVSSINTSRLLDRVHTDYMDRMAESQRIPNSSVSYNDKDGWKISIGISYGPGGGGFSCVIL